MRISVSFGTTAHRVCGWDGQFPVSLVRVYQREDGSTYDQREGRAMRADTLDRAIARAGRGWRYDAVDSWIELRNPKSRVRALRRENPKTAGTLKSQEATDVE